MLNTKKRRRKKKKTENFLSVRKKVTTQVPSKLPKSKPKLNANYKAEELEVRSALSSRIKKDDDFDAMRLDSQISFFINNVVPNTFDEGAQENGSEQSLRTNDNVLQLASSFVQVDDESPVAKCKKEKMFFDDTDLLYYPHGQRSDGMKVERSNLRDDGLYEPIKPSTSKNMVLLINRLNEENSNDWIVETNQLYGLHNFIQNTRLVRSYTLKEFTTISFVSRSHSTKGNQRHSDMSREKILKLHIYDITFHTHPCLNKEQIIARNIENLYKQYTVRRATGLSERLQLKLNALRRLQTFSMNESSSIDNRRAYKNEIRDLRNHLHREQKIDRDILKTILEQWKSLKKVRKEQGFVSTSIKLSIRTEAVDELADREEYNNNFELELNEILEESMEIYLKDRKNRKSGTNGSEDFELIKKIVKPDIENIREKLMVEYSNCVRPIGEPKIFVELLKIEDIVDSKKIRSNFLNSKFLLQIAFDNTKLNSVRNVQSVAGDRIVLDAVYSVKFRNTVPSNIELTVSVFYFNPK